MKLSSPSSPVPVDPPAVPTASFLALFTAVMLPMFMAAVDQTLLATATPVIAADLGGLGSTTWIAVGYLLASTLMAPLYGRLGDRFGRRRLLQVALVVFACGSLACALAPSMGLLIAGRALQGLGGGGLMVMSQALIGELVAPHERSRYQGYFAIVFTAASVGGPVLGGLVVSHAGWRWLFLAHLPLAALALWRTSRLSPPLPETLQRRPMDPVGALLFMLTASSALLWLSQIGHGFGLRSLPSALLAGTALLAGGLLAWQQRRQAAPFLPLDVMREPGMGWVAASVVAFASCMFGLIFMLPLYLQLGQGADAASAGLLLLPLTAGLVLGSFISGRFTARWGVLNRQSPWGLGAAGLALLALAWVPPSTGLTTALAAVCGLGFGTVMPNAQLTTQILGGQARLGASSALVSLLRSTGAAFGTAAIGGLVFALLPRGALEGRALVAGLPTPALVRGFHIGFAALGLMALAGAWASLHLPKLHLNPDDEGPPAAGGEV